MTAQISVRRFEYESKIKRDGYGMGKSSSYVEIPAYFARHLLDKGLRRADVGKHLNSMSKISQIFLQLRRIDKRDVRLD